MSTNVELFHICKPISITYYSSTFIFDFSGQIAAKNGVNCYDCSVLIIKWFCQMPQIGGNEKKRDAVDGSKSEDANHSLLISIAASLKQLTDKLNGGSTD